MHRCEGSPRGGPESPQSQGPGDAERFALLALRAAAVPVDHWKIHGKPITVMGKNPWKANHYRKEPGPQCKPQWKINGKPLETHWKLGSTESPSTLLSLARWFRAGPSFGLRLGLLRAGPCPVTHFRASWKAAPKSMAKAMV